MSGDSKPVFAYWDIRGLAQPIRNLLHYLDVDFEDKQYVLGPGPEFNRDCWLEVRNELGLPFPNLPYYIEGDIKIVQSNAIVRYIGRKHKLDGTDEASRVRVDIMENQLMDFRNTWVGLCYRRYEEGKDEYEKTQLPASLQAFSDFLGKNDFFAGKELTYVDFIAYELFDQHREWKKDALKAFPDLEKFMTRFKSLPKIKAYFSSDKFKKLPINNKMARFGATL